MLDISKKDREILREQAKKQMELANSPEMIKLKELWYKHNDCEGVRPLVTVELATFSNEILPSFLRCEGDKARGIEWSLVYNTFNHEYFKDDTVVKDYFAIGSGTWLKLFNHDDEIVQTKDENGNTGLGHQFIHMIEDLSEDYHKIQKSIYGYEKDYVEGIKNEYEELFGDILPIKIEGSGLYSVPTQKLVHMMGMENMFLAMYDYPELFLELMDRIANDTIEYFNFLEEKGLVLPTSDFESLGQGTYCCTKQLPGQEEAKVRKLKTKDIWGFMDSQETVSISPEMFKEFIFPCYEKISSRFGALSYGCCEPVDPIWDDCISKFKNIRKVSISPWCNEEIMGERLNGKKIIYHRKPNANFIGVGTTLDEDAVRASIRHTMQAARGCEIEFTQRDVYTINNDIDKVKRYVQLIREESEHV